LKADFGDDAVRLASSKQYLNQAFRFGSYAYGLQFHIEPNSETWSSWREHQPKQLAREDGLKRNRVAALGRQLIARFFDIALSPATSLRLAGGVFAGVDSLPSSKRKKVPRTNKRPIPLTGPF